MGGGGVGHEPVNCILFVFRITYTASSLGVKSKGLALAFSPKFGRKISGCSLSLKLIVC